MWLVIQWGERNKIKKQGCSGNAIFKPNHSEVFNQIKKLVLYVNWGVS